MYQVTVILAFLFIIGLILLNLILIFFNAKKLARTPIRNFFYHLWVYGNYIFFFILFAKAFTDTAITEHLAWNTLIIDKGFPPDIFDIFRGTPEEFLSHFLTLFPHWAIAMMASIIAFIIFDDGRKKYRKIKKSGPI